MGTAPLKCSAVTALLFFIPSCFDGIGPAIAGGFNHLSLTVGIGAGCGQSSTKIVNNMFSASSPKVHALLGGDVSLSYHLNDRSTVSLWHCTNWYRPGALSIINDYLLIAGEYRIRAFSSELSVGLGCGPGFITYPFDRYWRRHYSATGFAAGVRCGYRLSNKLGLAINDLFSMPQERIRLGDGLPKMTFMYLLNDVRLTVNYSLL
jgi:hypothetical protein